MNIQISVVIWTIICFFLLVLILRNWLFIPVINVMDRRRQRIEAAKFKEAEEENLRIEHTKMMLAQKSEYEQRQRQEMNKEIEAIQANTKLEIEEAKNKRIKKVEMYSCRLEEDYNHILQSVGDKTEEIAELFAERIISQ